MSASILILVTDGEGKGRLEIDGRLDLLGQFLSLVIGSGEKKPLCQFVQVDTSILPVDDPQKKKGGNDSFC